MNKRLGFLASVIFSSTCGQAANIHLLKSTPADGSVADTAPSAFVLQFSEPVQLHTLYLKRDDETHPKQVSNLPHADAAAFSIPAPSLTSGGYILEWVVFTRESTVLRGSVRFTVSAAQVRTTESSAKQ